MNCPLKQGCLGLLLGILLWLVTITPSEATTTSTTHPWTLQVLNRLSYGPRPGDVEHIQAIGVEAYFQEQLHSPTLPIPKDLEKQLQPLSSLSLTPKQILQLNQTFTKIKNTNQKPEEQSRQSRQQTYRQFYREAVTARLLRATENPQQLQEVMTEFWFNHFNVYGRRGRNQMWIASYENEAIRPYTLGNFRDLLEATAKHPAMLYYLDNVLNRVPSPRNPKIGINENYARELLELHTLGVDGGYTQADVISLAKILTGWGVIPANKLDDPIMPDNGFYFDDKKHDFSDKILLGKRIPGSGQEEGEQALALLALHPSTANHISYQLAQFFVSDRPPTSLVNQLSESYLQSGGEIKAVLTTLFRSPEFRDPQYFNQKFKTPYQYLLSLVRAMDLKIVEPEKINNLLIQMSMGLYDCLTPNGYPNTQEFWLNPNALLQRLTVLNSLMNRNSRLVARPSSAVTISDLQRTLGHSFSPKTLQVVSENPPAQAPLLLLGSPDFMYH